MDNLSKIKSEIEKIRGIIKSLRLLFKNYKKYKSEELIDLKTKYCSLIDESLKIIIQIVNRIHIENPTLNKWISKDLNVISENNNKINSNKVNVDVQKLCGDMNFSLINLESCIETNFKYSQ